MNVPIGPFVAPFMWFVGESFDAFMSRLLAPFWWTKFVDFGGNFRDGDHPKSSDFQLAGVT
jgi:hypothetical protein